MQEHSTKGRKSSILSAWLCKLENLHPIAVDLGLERVYSVALEMGLLHSPSGVSHDYSGRLNLPGVRVVTIAGTNGKGSCCKITEQCLLACGLTVGSYTSPHLLHYCERITINGVAASDPLVCQAFAEIDCARQGVSLTYFEFGTLAALWLFQQFQVDVVLLEVGVGGRLDATNIVDADIAVITSISMDHQHWLGNDRASIATEKAGICRRGKPVICADDDPPATLLPLDNDRSTYWIDKQFSCKRQLDKTWLWQSCTESQHYLLPQPQLPVPSIAAGLQVASLLDALPTQEQLATIIAQTSLPGRYQQLVIHGCECIVDIAHNPAATQLLAERLNRVTITGKTRAIFAVMADKDIAAMLSPLLNCVDQWYIGELTDNPRAASMATLAALLTDNAQCITEAENIKLALAQALTDAGKHDRIIVFGSFYTVEAALILAHQRLGSTV